MVVAHSANNQPVLVDWFADWCGPCRLVEPFLKDLHAAGDVRVVKCKPEETEDFRAWLKQQGARFNIAGLPTLILFQNGKPVKSLVGRFTQEKLAKFVDSAASGVRGVVTPTMAANARTLQPIPVPVDDMPPQAPGRPMCKPGDFGCGM